MDLKTLQTELQRLSQMAQGWQRAEEITTIERELVLARLRDLYEAVRFGLESRSQEQPQSPFAPLPVVEAEQKVEPEVEELTEAEPFALEADDFFSLDAVMPVEEEAEEAFVEEEAIEEEPLAVIPAEEEQTPEEEMPLVEEEVLVVEDVTAIEEVTAAEEPAAEEPVVEEEIAAEAEPMPIQEEESPEEPMIPVVEEPTPAVEEPTVPLGNLFGIEPEQDRHRRKQRVIMSLYDVAEPLYTPQPIAKEEPVSEPESVVAPEPVAEPEPIVAAEPEPEPIDSIFMPVDETDEEADVIEISEEELESEESEVPIDEMEEIELPIEEPATPVVIPEEEPAPVLGEVIQPPQTLAEKLAAQQTVNDLRPRITDLRRAVGLNDKFLLIRDLFGGNGSLYEITIRKLNEFDNFDDCMIYIAEHFAWNPNSDGAKLMLDLLERKFEQQ